MERMFATSQTHLSEIGERRCRLMILPATSAVCSVTLLFLLWTGLYGQTDDPWTLLASIQNDYNRINDYVVDVHTSQSIPGLSVPEMKATIYYRKPDQLRIESKSFAMLPRDVLLFRPSMFEPAVYDAMLQGTVVYKGIACTMIKLIAKADTIRLQHIELYVDPVKREIRRLQIWSHDASPVTADITYAQVQTYSIPSAIIVEMNSPTTTRRGGIPFSGKNSNNNDKAQITLRYTNYRINKGIPDAIFSKKTQQK